LEHIIRSIEEIDRVLEVKDSVRENAIKMSRDIIRLSSDAITYTHLNDREKARETIQKLDELVKEFIKLVEPHEELKHSGFVNNALTEYVEAKQFYSYVFEGRLLSLAELKVHYVPYLLGLCDFVGELRRFVIDRLRERDITKCFECLRVMELIYNAVRKLDYPDALVPGLRHKVDVMRRLIEDLRAYLLDIATRIELMEAISSLKSKQSQGE